MLHYNFPAFSVGETGRYGAPGRREIGHGALGERALLQVMPSEDEFPYTVRVVSEVLRKQWFFKSSYNMCWMYES